MSGADPTMFMAANHGNVAKLITSPQSVWDTQSYSRSNIFAVDNTFSSKPTGQPANMAGTDRFRLRKRGGRVFNTYAKITLSAGVLAAGHVAAYVNDLGAAIIGNVRLEYAAKNIQEYNGELLKAYQRLLEHDITREHYNARNSAGLPPGGALETSRSTAVTTGTVVFPAFSWLFFTRSSDYALTPEALSSEMEVNVDYRRLEELVYARTNPGGLVPVVDPFTTRPRITESLLFTQLVHTPGPEKAMHLKRFESDQGVIFKILDIEQQLNQAVPAAAGVYTIKLDNFRLDSQFMLFFLRDSNVNVPWAVDRMSSDPTATVLTGGGSVAGLLGITSFRLIANGKTIVDPCTDIENRAVWRDHYFPGSQIADPIYFIPFGQMLRDHRNVVGYQNLANLGSVELEITVPLFARSRLLDVYNVHHNIVQQKMGDIIRIVR